MPKKSTAFYYICPSYQYYYPYTITRIRVIFIIAKNISFVNPYTGNFYFFSVIIKLTLNRVMIFIKV